MIVWEPTEGRAQFIRLLSRTRAGMDLACTMLTDDRSYVFNVTALVVDKEYKLLSRWFPTHVVLRYSQAIAPQYTIISDNKEAVVGLSRSAATRHLANNPSALHLPRSPRNKQVRIKSLALAQMYVPMHLSMATDLEQHIASIPPTMKSEEMLQYLENFFASHVLHDEQVEMQHQVLLEQVDGYHNDMHNCVLSSLTRVLTVCLT